MSLYVEENGRLRRILRDLPMSRYGGESDTRCEGRFNRQKSVLTVEPSHSHCWADLSRRTASTHIFVRPQAEDCVDSTTTVPLSPQRLRYDGHRYPAPELASPWDLLEP